MNFSQLQSFVALADTGSFTEAAYSIDLTQSAVSHALAALESELGVTLIERNRKGVVALTSVGQKIIPHVRILLAQAEAITQEARAAQGQMTGKLRLGSVLSLIAPDMLASLLTCFRSAYPDIEVVLFEGAMYEVGEWIENGIVDVGFVVLPARGIESTPITTDEFCVLIPTRHRLHKEAAIQPEELYREDFILDKSHCVLQLMKRAGLDPERVKTLIRYQASDSATILAMVREGLGITLIPRTMLPKKLEGLVALPLAPSAHLRIGLAVKARETACPAATLFIQTALNKPQERAPLLA